MSERRSSSIEKWLHYYGDYYCGSGAAVFFGDTWIDDLVTLQYTVSKSKIPLHGYASEQFDAVMRGKVLVQGTFSIAFKEVGYLDIIMSKLKKGIPQYQSYKDLRGRIKQKEWSRLGLHGVENEAGLFGENFYEKSPMAGWTYKEVMKNGQLVKIRQPRVSRMNIEEQLGELGEQNIRNFESLAENLEDSIWGVKTDKPGWNVRGVRRADQFDEVTEKSGNLLQKYIDPDGFNILTTFGEVNDSASEHTVKSLVGVHIVDESMVIGPTADPILQQFSFFARGSDEAIGSFNIKSSDNKTQESKRETSDERTRRVTVESINVRMYADASYFTNAAQIEKDRSDYTTVHGVNISTDEINMNMGSSGSFGRETGQTPGQIDLKTVEDSQYRLRNKVTSMLRGLRGYFSDDPWAKVTITVEDNRTRRYLGYLYKVRTDHAELKKTDE